MNFDYAAEKDRKILIALIFSAAVHILLLCNWPIYRNLFMEKMRPGDIEVTYLKSGEQPAGRQSEMPVKGPETLPEISQPHKLISAEIPKAIPVRKDEPGAPKKEPLIYSPPKKPAGEKTSRIVIRKPVMIPKIETTASVDVQGLRIIPSSYSQVVRDRIIANLDTRKAGGEGDVYVRFVIVSSGTLKEVSIIDERSTDNGVLRIAAFEAVKNSAPFPSFPQKAELPEIVFTCQITFARR